MEGKVKFFNNLKGFGFITGNDEKDYFVHTSGLIDGVRLNNEDAVVFDVEKTDRGFKAINVKKA